MGDAAHKHTLALGLLRWCRFHCKLLDLKSQVANTAAERDLLLRALFISSNAQLQLKVKELEQQLEDACLAQASLEPEHHQVGLPRIQSCGNASGRTT